MNPEVIILRFTWLVFGLVCSPFILNVTLRNHLSKYENIDPDFANTDMRALYVDIFASGKDSVKDCFELYGNSDSEKEVSTCENGHRTAKS